MDTNVQTPAQANILNCMACGNPFTLEQAERQVYIKNGLQDPKRCKSCRNNRKTAKQSEWGSED